MGNINVKDDKLIFGIKKKRNLDTTVICAAAQTELRAANPQIAGTCIKNDTKLFPHHVGALCTLLEPRKCHLV